MTRRTGQPADGERGMILVVVLWTVSILTVIAVALTTYVHRNLASITADNLQLRSEMALRAGLNVAGAMILGVKEDDRLFAATIERTADIGGGRSLDIALTDATAAIDLNKADQTFMQNVFTAVLQSKGEGKQMAEAVAGLRKIAVADKQAGDGPAKPKGVSDASVQARPGPAPDATKPAARQEDTKAPDTLPLLVSPLQLLALPGMKPGDVNRIIPFAGVASKDGKVNPMTASSIVLEAVPKIKEGDLELIRQARSRKDVESETFKTFLQGYGAYLTIEPPRVYRVSVTIRGGPGLIANSRQVATFLLTPDAPKPFQVLNLSW